MEWLNYHHLLYFWTVAKEGSVAKASEVLRLAQPTVSGQVKQLEQSLGEQLFERKGRNLVLTETGEVVFGYASEIFGLGRELMDSLRGRPSGRPGRLNVGISDVFPKLIAFRVLEQATNLDPPVEIVCREDKTERLLAELSVHGFDLILTDTPVFRSGQRQGVQPFARAKHGQPVRGAQDRRAIQTRISRVPQRRAVPLTDHPLGPAASDRPLVRSERDPSAGRGRIRRLGADESVRRARSGHLSRRDGDRSGHPSRLLCPQSGPGRRCHRALLRDHSRAPNQASGRAGHLPNGS